MTFRLGAPSITISGSGAAPEWQQIHDRLREQVREAASRVPLRSLVFLVYPPNPNC
jgi:hypothetical protein